MKWEIPRINDTPLTADVVPNHPIFIVGPNGSGKSALIQQFIGFNRLLKFRRISAQRQTWFQSGSVDITPAQRIQYAENNVQLERDARALWTEFNPQHKQSAIVFDLVAKENHRARSIMQLIDDGNAHGAVRSSSEFPSPFSQMNEILELGSLNIKLELSANEQITATNRVSGAKFSMTQMSDGERNAVIIAANVLTVEPGTILLIDEPERHLHRSIIEPFLSALYAIRQDCAFVISTHEVWLPIANPNATVLLVRSCKWIGNSVSGWDVDKLEPDTEMPEDLKHAILGSRRAVLFTEGTSISGDVALYEALFPDISIVPKEGCENVIRAVHGVRGSENLHHARAFGLIDRDSREPVEVNELADNQIYALNVYAVESIYYCSDAIVAVAERQAESLGLDAGEMVSNAHNAAFESLNDDQVIRNFAAIRSASTMRNEVFKQLPNANSARNGSNDTFKIEVSFTYQDEIAHINRFIANRDLDGIVGRYPIRKSNMRKSIASALELKSTKAYEQTLITQVRTDPILATALKSRIDPLARALEDALTESAARAA